MDKIKSIWLLTAVITLLNVAAYQFQLGGKIFFPLWSSIFPIVSSFIAAFSVYRAFLCFKTFDKAKLAWLMMYLGVFLFFLAECIYAFGDAVLKINMDKAFPTVADFIWVVAYLPLIIGCIMMIYWYNSSGFLSGSVRVYVWSIVPFFALAGLVFSFLLIPIAVDVETKLLAKAVYLYYPVADLILIICAGILMYITSLFGQGIITKAWRYMSLGFIVMCIPDLLYSYLNWSGKYSLGNWIDVWWTLSYLLIAVGAVYQQELMRSLDV